MTEAPPSHRLGRGRRWLSRAYAVLVIAALVGVLVIVANSTRLIEQLTAEVAVAQRRSEHLSNSQREVLRLLQAVTVAAANSPPTAPQLRTVQVRRGLFGRQIVVAGGVFTPDSAEGRELQAIATQVDELDWSALERGDPKGVDAIVDGLVVAERRAKVLYDAQTRGYYYTTARSLQAKERGQDALAGLAGLVAILGFGWIATIRRASRNDLRRAYEALVVEMQERRAAEDAVRTSEQRFRSLVQRASDLTCVIDSSGVLTYVSPAVDTLLGFDPEDFVGSALAERVHVDDRPDLAAAITELRLDPTATATVDFRVQASDGRWRNIEAVGRNLLEDSAILGIVWNGRDVTDRRLLEEQLTHQAYHDALTGLPNRALLVEHLELARINGRDVAVLLIDLDGFKAVNDTLGHPAGDELLRQVAHRLTGCLRADDAAARLGGDEFAAIVDTRSDVDLKAIADRILVAIRKPFDIGGRTVIVGASIGVATSQVDASDLLRDADIAMYMAKAAGKNRVELFEPLMLDRTTEQSTLEQQLSGAMARGEFEVYYQPIVSLTTGRIIALESLARWRHPERGYVPPGVFIPIAERTGLIVELGRHMLAEACAAVARWRQTLPEHRDLGITVNVSGRQAVSGDLVTQVAQVLAASGLEPGALTLEITESVLLDDTDAIRAHFTALRNLGVHVAVDDFGAGYSSIGSLLRFSADVLKIDRSFLEFDSARHGSLVQAVSDLGRSLDLLVVAEGVETADQVGLARDAGCHAAQGYWFARPGDERATALLLGRTRTLIDTAEPADV
jgi:diguanylate cyclase (GGDEF)-like protein/PAS domain S-box-containing protein